MHISFFPFLFFPTLHFFLLCPVPWVITSGFILICFLRVVFYRRPKLSSSSPEMIFLLPCLMQPFRQTSHRGPHPLFLRLLLALVEAGVGVLGVGAQSVGVGAAV